MDNFPDMENISADFPDMENTSPDSGMMEKVLEAAEAYDDDKYTPDDVLRALRSERCTVEGFQALLSSAAAPYLEEMAARAKRETGRHFGNTVYLFTPLYISNYCENHCVYCGFNCRNKISRKKLNMEEIEREMQVIAAQGIEEVLILTGESRAASGISYIGEAVKLGKKYFRNIGLEIYPVNTDEYRHLHACGADYVTVFQETYDRAAYARLHPAGRKRVFPYRFYAQERAILGGMRGVGLSALFGLGGWRRDALASALHAYHLQRKYPAVEYSLSCPRIRPAKGESDYDIFPVSEAELCQMLCAYRIFLPFAGITVSSRENKKFRDGIVKIAATKVSAGVSTGIGDHESKYEYERDCDCGAERHGTGAGDEQFEIADGRSLPDMYGDIKAEGLQPVLNDYIYV